MTNRSFWVGIFLSPLILGFFWLMENKTTSAIKIQSDVPLATFDFVPTNPRTQVPTRSFTHIDLETGDKKEITLTEYSGKPTIVHFWATWCAPCVEEMPDLEKYAATHGEELNFVVVASDQSGGREAEAFYKSKGIKNLKIHVDAKGEFIRAMKINALPSTVFVTAGGKEMGRVIGMIDWTGKSGGVIHANLTKGGE